MTDRSVNPRTGGWPPISNALAAASYSAMIAQSINAPASSIDLARSGASMMIGRGKELSAGERAAKASRVGKAADRVALKAAAAAESPVAHAFRAATANPIGQAASRALSLAGKAAIPLMLGKAAIDAAIGYDKDGARGATLGAIDSLAFGRGTATYNGYQKGGVAGAVDALTFGIASWAAKHVKQHAPASAQSTDPTHMDATKAREFERAEQAFEARRMRGEWEASKAEPQGSGLVGFQNQSTLASALAAQGKAWSGEYLTQPRPR